MAKNSKLNSTAIQTNNKQIAKPSQSERNQVLTEANTEFLELYNKIRTRLTNEEVGIIRSRYDIGEMLEEASKDESTYGSNFVKRMEIAIGLERSIIYNSLIFVQRYDRDEMDQLIQLRNKAGQPLLWTHVTHLIRITDRKVREELVNVTLDGNFTPTELSAYIDAKQGKSIGRTSNAGKPMARPKSLKGFIDQQYEMVQQLLRRKEKVWAGSEKPGDKCFFDVLDETPREKIDKSFINDMEQLQRLYESAAEHMDQMGTELLRARTRLEKELKAAKDEEDAAWERQAELEREADRLIDEAGGLSEGEDEDDMLDDSADELKNDDDEDEDYEDSDEEGYEDDDEDDKPVKSNKAAQYKPRQPAI